MSRAYICDKCGRILPDGADVEFIWLRNPIIFNDDCREVFADIHLCGGCYSDFEGEYMKNLKESYEQA